MSILKAALLLSNVIDAYHQNSCLFTNKGHFSSPLRVYIAFIFHLNQLTFQSGSTSTRTWVCISVGISFPPIRTINSKLTAVESGKSKQILADCVLHTYFIINLPYLLFKIDFPSGNIINESIDLRVDMYENLQYYPIPSYVALAAK